MYWFKRYQKAFTLFMSGGYMKFSNLIIRIVLDLNKIYFFVKYQLSEITSYSKFLKMHTIRWYLFILAKKLSKPSGFGDIQVIQSINGIYTSI